MFVANSMAKSIKNKPRDMQLPHGSQSKIWEVAYAIGQNGDYC
jgi:hypothetical protein